MWYPFPNSLVYKFWLYPFKRISRLVYCLSNQKNGHFDGTFEYPISRPLGRFDLVSRKEWTEIITLSVPYQVQSVPLLTNVKFSLFFSEM